MTCQARSTDHIIDDTTRPQGEWVTQEHVDNGSGKRNLDSGLQVQLEDDGDDSIRQSYMETSGL